MKKYDQIEIYFIMAAKFAIQEAGYGKQGKIADMLEIERPQFNNMINGRRPFRESERRACAILLDIEYENILLVGKKIFNDKQQHQEEPTKHTTTFKKLLDAAIKQYGDKGIYSGYTKWSSYSSTKKETNNSVSETSELAVKTVRHYRKLATMDADTFAEIQTWIDDMEKLKPGFTGWFRHEFQNRFPEFDEWKGKIIKNNTTGTDC